MEGLPPRYEPLHRLGQGGGGEVWAVRDRVLGTTCALKVLAKDAGESELVALVREATALSGLEGLGVPRVLAFGSLLDSRSAAERDEAPSKGGRRYMVRELVEGRSLEELLEQSTAPRREAPDQATDDDPRNWLEPLAHAADQLTAIHRAGLLHGDIKPANVIIGRGAPGPGGVGPERRGTLVDLGLAAPWREGGTRARGLTPKYAAPELLAGGPLTVRAEVYALTATLAEGLARRGSSLPDEPRMALAKVAARGKDDDPQKRYPSTAEIASAIRLALGIGIGTSDDDGEHAWPVVGIDAVAQALAAAERKLGPGDALALVGEAGAGKSTLLRRLAWTMGIEGKGVVLADVPRTGMSRRDALALEVDPATNLELLAIDDGDTLPADARALVKRATRAGARLVIVGSESTAATCAVGQVTSFVVPALDTDTARNLLMRAMPSLPHALVPSLALRTAGRPGALRNAVRALAGRAVVSESDVDEALADEPITPPASKEEALARAERLIDLGRVTRAEDALLHIGPDEDATLQQRRAIAEARIRTHQGEPLSAIEILEEHAEPKNAAWHVAMSRALLRAGRFADAALAASRAGDADVEGLATLGVARAYTGDDAGAIASATRALDLARERGNARGEGFALGSLGIVHQRASRIAEANEAYLRALPIAERARDATTVVATRMNLAAIAREEGDIARALEHLEATVDLGKRAGGLMAVEQARINLVNLDLYLGRFARARAALAGMKGLGAARAQLLGCRAELAARTGDVPGAARLYEECASAYDALGRTTDAAEARLEGLFMRAGASPEPVAMLSELVTVEAAAGEAHRALSLLVRGVLESKRGRDDEARSALDEAIELGKQSAQHERVVWALAARARVLGLQGLRVQARKDVEAALVMLEDTASKLPRDLREVFWDEPRRSALRSATNATLESVREPKPIAFRDIPITLGEAPVARSQTFSGEDKLARVLEIVREIATEHDLPKLLAKVTDHALALLGGENGFVLLTNADGTLDVHAARDRKGDDPHAAFSRSVAEQVVASGEPVVAVRAREDARLAKAVSVHQLAIQSIACVPVRGAPPLGRPIGALYVETRLRPGARFDDELPILRAFADQAAIAIENARLLEENRSRAEQLAEAHERLEAALGRRTEQLADARRDLKRVRASLRNHFGYGGLVGTSVAMRRVYALIDRMKDTDVPALVTGESGTGKEVVARAIHDAGPRARRTFMGINCGAIPANLLESELFGHVRGAFTSADRDRKGLLRECEGGTLLLDEIGDLPLKMQTSLLRVLQEKTVRPIGGTKEEPVDVRILAATNRDLEEMVKAGTFREDFFYRLHVVEVRVPSLRERSEDIPPLIDHFLGLFSTRFQREKKTIHRDAVRRLCAYEWPGNVRQLEHVLLSAWLMGEGNEIVLDDLQLPDTRPSSSRQGMGGGPKPAKNAAEFKDSEKDRILRALAACNWNRVKAAELVGIPRRTFYRRLKEFGIR